MDYERATEPHPEQGLTRAPGAPSKGRAWLMTWCGAAVILALALFLRGKDLDSGRMSPDDGEFLHSARVHELAPSRDLSQALTEDRAWIAVLAEDHGRIAERTSFQHSYLHQLAIRWAWRLGGTVGLGRVTALRADQALLGALTALLVFVWLRRAIPAEPFLAWVGGALVATQLLHVHTSRTGWGQAGCTFFLVAMYALAWRMRDVRNDQPWRLFGYALLIAAASLLAYGFHEMATVYVAALALIIVFEFGIGDDARRQWPWSSRRTWLGLAACAPVGALTVALLMTSEYARETWFNTQLSSYSWSETRRLSLSYLWQAGMVQQLGVAVLLLAPIGLVGAVLRDARYARWLVLCAAVPTAALFLRFNNPSLPRIYLPLGVLLCMFAAEGVGVLCALARGRWPRAAAQAVAFGAVALGAATSWQTLMAPASAPLHVAGLHRVGARIDEPRRPLDPLLDALRQSSRPPTEVVGVGWVWGPLYRLFDASFPALIVNTTEPDGEWPRHVIAPMKSMGGGQRLARDGGRWHVLAVDGTGQLGLYERRD
ncbi:MAG: hypothetical protein R3F49_09675 [Planctomycetota bacterium]